MEGLIWLLFLGGFFYFMMRYGCGAHMVHGHGGHTGHDHTGHAGHAGHSTLSRDPVCGMEVDDAVGYERIYTGRQYRFCSERCRDKFDVEPTRYGA